MKFTVQQYLQDLMFEADEFESLSFHSLGYEKEACETGLDAFLQKCFEYDLDEDDDIIFEEDYNLDSLDFDSQKIKERRRNRRKQSISSDKKLSRTAKTAINNFSKRLDSCISVYHPRSIDEKRFDRCINLYKKCSKMGLLD